MSGVKEGNVTVGRVLSGPCAGGHGGQVISEQIPMVQECDLNWVFSKRKDPQSNPHAPPTVFLPALVIDFVGGRREEVKNLSRQ